MPSDAVGIVCPIREHTFGPSGRWWCDQRAGSTLADQLFLCNTTRLDRFGVSKALHRFIEYPYCDEDERDGIDKGNEGAHTMIAKGFAGIGRPFRLCRCEPGQAQGKNIGECMSCVRKERQ